MGSNAITPVNITTAEANSTIALGAEKGALETVIISGTFTAGSLTLRGRREKGYAPVSGGVFTEAGIYNNLVKNITSYEVIVSADFEGDVWVELA